MALEIELHLAREIEIIEGFSFIKKTQVLGRFMGRLLMMHPFMVIIIVALLSTLMNRVTLLQWERLGVQEV